MIVGEIVSDILQSITDPCNGSLVSSPEIKQLFSDSMERAWESIAGALYSLGFEVVPVMPSDWRDVLDKLGFSTYLSGTMSLMEAKAIILNLVSLEGDCQLVRMPLAGEVSVESRILHLRRKYVGLYDPPVDTPYGKYQQQWERVLRDRFNLAENCQTLELANILGDISELWKILKKSLVKRKRPFLIFNGKTATSDWSVDTLESSVNQWSSGLDSDESLQFHEPVDYSYEGINDFGLNLIRLTLWINGVAETPSLTSPDYDLTETICQGLRSRGIDASDQTPGSVKNYIRYLGQSLWIVNIDSFIEAMVSLKMAECQIESAPDHASALALVIAKSPECENDIHFMSTIEQIIKSGGKRESPPVIKNSMIKCMLRMYEGAKRAIRLTIKVVQQGISWIHEKIVLPIKQFMLKSIDSILQGWRTFTEIIGPKVKAFFNGILFDKKPNGEVVLSRRSFDVDTLVIVSADAGEDILCRHATRLVELSHTMKRIGRLVGDIFNLIIRAASGPIGWAKLAFRIGAMIVDFFASCLKIPATR